MSTTDNTNAETVTASSPSSSDAENYSPWKLLDVKSELKAEDDDPDTTGTEPLLAGIVVDFADANEDVDPFAVETRQKHLINAMKEFNLTDRPCMAVQLNSVDQLGLLARPHGSNDESDWSEYRYKHVAIPDDKHKRLGAARIVVPAVQIADLSNLSPEIGQSVVKVNPAYPPFRWFQSINLQLKHKAETGGRVIPFPLQSNTRHDADGNLLDPMETIIYKVLKVDHQTYLEYFRLLEEAVKQDGPHRGFYHAAKFGYEVLLRKAGKVTQELVENNVTAAVPYGKPRMRGVLVLNSTQEDWDEDLSTSHFVYG
jgi:hypothetical protein